MPNALLKNSRAHRLLEAAQKLQLHAACRMLSLDLGVYKLTATTPQSNSTPELLQNGLCLAESEAHHLAFRELRAKSNEIFAKHKLQRSSEWDRVAQELGAPTLEEQHYNLALWAHGTLKPYLQPVSRQTSVRARHIIPDDQTTSENSRERDKWFRQKAKIAVKGDIYDRTVVLMEIIYKPGLSARLDQSTLRNDVYDALNLLMAGTDISSGEIEAWCRKLSEVSDVAGAAELPAAIHAFAKETWDFYRNLLGLDPKVNANFDDARTPYQNWSTDLAFLVFPGFETDSWDTALRNRGGGLGERYLAQPQVAAMRSLLLPWTKIKSMENLIGGT